MSERRPALLELMRLHVEALYVHDARGCIESINQWDRGRVPRFYLGRTGSGHLWRVSADLPDDVVTELATFCSDEPPLGDPSEPPRHVHEYVRILSRLAPVERIWSGPAYRFSKRAAPTMPVVAINQANMALLRGGLDAWLPDVPHRQPFVAIVQDGHAVAVCTSVRITNAAHEAGVETLPAYRRRGYAANAVAEWANVVQKLGAIPLYSTSWDNAASQRVAATLGLAMFGVDFHVM